MLDAVTWYLLEQGAPMPDDDLEVEADEAVPGLR